MAVIALVPARSGSKSIPGKNFRELGGKPLFVWALDCALEVGCDAYLSTDASDFATSRTWFGMDQIGSQPATARARIDRPAELAQDDTPMLAVVQHALEQVPGEPDDIIVLLQPTQPFRTPARVREAIQLLQSTGADSVVSVVPLPLTHHPWVQFTVDNEGVWDGPYLELYEPQLMEQVPATRQEMEHVRTYIRDGSCYVFRRETVTEHGNIYGEHIKPLILEPHETCELDTEEQFREVEARWRREHAR
jgi:CMP-N,N'-diacetyllegionaminic acid synthase